MSILLAWAIAYVLLASISYLVALRQKSLLRSLIVVHVFILVSAFLLFALGARLEFVVGIYSICFASAVVFLSCAFLKQFGLAYVFSSAIQESWMLLSFALLLPVTGFWVAATLTVLPYAFLHLINSSGWWWKVGGTFIWGMLSLFLYMWLRDPLLNITLHALGGGLLIRQGLLLTKASLRSSPNNDSSAHGSS